MDIWIFYFLQISVYASYLYDAVLLYARALNQTLEEGREATDGRSIISKIQNTSYIGRLMSDMCGETMYVM